MRAAALALLVCAAAADARAEPQRVLRLATVAPDGTSWAREARAFAAEVERSTAGRVRIKWFLGAIAGGEGEMLERARRDQLDGLVSGGPVCEQVAPSMRPMQLPGLFQSRAESVYVMNRLRPLLDDEFRRAGFANLGEVSLGPGVLFLRAPVHSMAEVRRLRLWIWDALFEGASLSYQRFADLLGVTLVPLPIEAAGRAYEEGRVDAFFAVPTAALAFQWSVRARYVLDLHVAYAVGCLLVTNRAYDAMPFDDQRALLDATARMILRLDDLGRRQDAALLGGLFERQGVKRLVPSEAFRAQFFEAARTVRERLGEEALPQALLQRMLGMLADYRAEHRADVAQSPGR